MKDNKEHLDLIHIHLDLLQIQQQICKPQHERKLRESESYSCSIVFHGDSQMDAGHVQVVTLWGHFLAKNWSREAWMLETN